ncbi:MAG: transposase [Methylobacter sp.]|nr:transposase [Methylobacter sp.]MDP2098049.1 transposase [Methylobacter sp.]MDP2426666.1 transposase [Methylobacter sp.]MDP3053128.1 transposase [Methylobacter sp.]MDP3362350.1 transposase [Methylobacter sp.]
MGKGKSFDYAYNAQISVDADLQIIVGQHISQNANDKQEVEPALQALQQTTGRLPDKLSADNGYISGGNLQAFEDNHLDAYIATDKGEKTHKLDLDHSERKVVKADFDYNATDNTFTCPNGQILPMVSAAKDGSRVYQGCADVCAACPLNKRCCQSEKGQTRTINTDDKEPLRQEMNRKMATDAAKTVYKQRKVIVEPVFGQIKNAGFRGFSVRGKDKVAGEFSMVCAAHNFKKIAKAIFTGLIRPEFGHDAANAAI